MKDLEKLGLEGQFNRLDSTPPEDAKPVSSVMTLEATVDAKPQELKKIRPYFESNKDVPSTLTPEGQIVMHALFSCFDQQKTVQEGKLGDLVWGFEQGGIPGPATVMGLKCLHKEGYVKFQGPDNGWVSEMTKDNLEHLWVRYTSKLLNLVYAP